MATFKTFAVSNDVQEILDSCLGGNLLTHEQALRLFEIEAFTPDYYALTYTSHTLNYAASGGIAEVHGQIGIDANPCSKDCEWCSFASINPDAHPNETNEMPLDMIMSYAHDYYEAGANALSIMITGDYGFEKYLGILEALHAKFPDFPIMANMGDFDVPMAEELKAAGAKFVYHAIRMGEGTRSVIPLETRVKTIEAAHAVGLKVSTCVEMILPEYSAEEVVSMIELSVGLRCEDGNAFGLLAVPNTKIYNVPQYSWAKCAVFSAIYRLMAGTEFMPFTGETMSWAEVGTNPRDNKLQTEKGGMGPDLVKSRMEFEQKEWKVPRGPSKYWSGLSERPEL